MIRDTIKAAQITAMKAGEKDRLAAVRLILAKIKDRDIELRTASQQPDDDAMVVEVMQKMIKQRRESIALYEQGGRVELAAIEAAELAIIEDFLPAQMSDAETSAAIEGIKAELGAETITVTSVSAVEWLPVFPTPEMVQPFTASALSNLGL